MKKLLFLASVAVGTVACVVSFLKSPRFALYSLGNAIDASNEQGVLQYLDVETLSKQITDIYIEQNKAKAIQRSNTSAEMIGTTIGLGMVEAMRPTLESKMHQTLLQGVTSEVQKYHSGVAMKLLTTDITSDGDKAIALCLRQLLLRCCLKHLVA